MNTGAPEGFARPVWVGDDGNGRITVKAGQRPQLFLSLTPDEAERVGRMLITASGTMTSSNDSCFFCKVA